MIRIIQLLLNLVQILQTQFNLIDDVLDEGDEELYCKYFMDFQLMLK